MDFSIIIPLYNEEKRLPKTIDKIFSFFSKFANRLEIIFVNDGSTDNTKKILEDYKGKYNFKLIDYAANRGKGFAVRSGALSAQGEWIIFFDIDLATPLEEFDHFLDFKSEQDQIVVGSRRLKSSQIKKSESGLRVFLGQGFTKLSNILVPNISDFTCGFKCFSKAAADKIFSVARIDRWGFDTELLYIAQLRNIPIKQMPVTWSHDEDSRVKIGKAIWNSFCELIQMKINQIRGFYR